MQSYWCAILGIIHARLMFYDTNIVLKYERERERERERENES